MRKKIALTFLGTLVFYMSSLAQGVKVLAPLSVNSSTDRYATHFDSLGSGGYVTVANIISRDNISSLRRKIGMMVYVAEVDSAYQLIGGILNANWRGFKLSPGGSIMSWQGSLAVAPSNPLLNWGYYNTTDKKSYLYDGTGWQILAQDGVNGTNGTNGISVSWRGSLATAPSSPQLNWGYYNTADKKSYVYDGTSWQMLTQDGVNGTDGISVSWRGSLATAPSNPQLNWGYYNTADKKSYVYDGSSWQILSQDGVNGTDGISVSWRGSLTIAPSNPQLNWGYYNTADKKSYVYDGSSWQILTQDGVNGTNGTNGTNGISVSWRGSLATAPSSPQLNWGYYNTTDKISYIYDGSTWKILSQDGANGTSISWKGSLASAPLNPELNWGYYNTADKKSYIYDGSSWQILSQDGISGGGGGTGISWQGSWASPPSNPQLNWAYYNTTDKISYIYDGGLWQILAMDGTSGTNGRSINWQGTLTEPPSQPQINWAYYNPDDRISYIYDGNSWNVLTVDGNDGYNGMDGVSISWQGSLSTYPVSPQLNWAFYHTIAKESYIYDGTTWKVLTKDGVDGVLKANNIQYNFHFESIDQESLSIPPFSDRDTTITASLPDLRGFYDGTVVVSPDKDLPSGIVIAWARLSGVQYRPGMGVRTFPLEKLIKFRLVNITSDMIILPPLRFWISIIYTGQANE